MDTQWGERQRRWDVVYAHHDRLLRLCRARLDDRSEAEDCVQEAMLRCVEFADLDETRLGQFLTSVTMRLCADVHRRRTRGDRLALRLASFSAVEPGPEETVCDRAESVWLSDRVEDLPPRQRAIVSARAEGLSCTAVADRFSMSYTAIESALARARRSLRTALESTLGVAAGWPRRVARVATGAAAAAATTVTVAVGVMPHVATGALGAPDATTGGTRAGVADPGFDAVDGHRAGSRTLVALAFSAPRRDVRPAPHRHADGFRVEGPGDTSVSTYQQDSRETPSQRRMDCVRNGVQVGRTTQCNYPPGDHNNDPESIYVSTWSVTR